MIGSVHPTRTRASAASTALAPTIGPGVPISTLHLVFLAVAAGLCRLVLDDPFWRAVGLLLALAATIVPNLVPRWTVLFVLGLSQLWREPSVTDVRIYALLAGLHWLHLVGSLAREMPWRGRIEWRAFAGPLRRFVLVQAGVQAVAVGALLAFGSGHGTVHGLSIFAAALLGVVAAVLGRGLRDARRRERLAD